MNNKTLASFVRKAYSRQADRDSKALPRARTKFDPPLSVKNAVYTPYGTHLYTCFHNKLYVEPCPKCKRSEADALENLKRIFAS